MMKAILFSILSGIVFPALSQSTSWNWSELRCTISNSSDSTFIVQTEKRMWSIEKKTNAFTLYEGFNGGWGYNVRMSKFAMERAFEDTAISKLQFTNTAELLTLWNNPADTFWLIGFQPMVTFERNHRWYTEKDWVYKTCYVHIPLYTYQSNLEKREMQRLKNTALMYLSDHFGARLSGDTLLRTITFVDDSNNYLPQARYSHMAGILKNGMLAGQVGCYSDDELQHRMSKAETERSFAYWDSSNVVKDPNNPGILIIAPIKIEAQAIGIVINEQWKPALCAEEHNNNAYPNYRPQPYMSFAREVQSYGLVLSSGKIIWIEPRQFDAFLLWPKFYRAPYDESFRAERFDRMQIQLYPY